MYLKELFRQADKNHSGTLNLKECTELITNFLHVKTKKDLNQLFNEADFDKTGKFIHAKYYKLEQQENLEILNDKTILNFLVNLESICTQKAKNY